MFINIPNSGSQSWKFPVQTIGELPANGNNPGDARVVIDDNIIYVWDGSAWQAASSPSTTPGGLSGSIQYNDSGTFGGFGSFDGTDTTLPGDLIVSGGDVFSAALTGSTSSGGNLTLRSTSNATKGKILLSGTSGFDESKDYLGLGTQSPSVNLDIPYNTSFPPTILSSAQALTSTNSFVKLAVQGRFLYGLVSPSAGNLSFQIWDIYNPAAPVQISTLALSGSIGRQTSILIQNGFAFIATTGSVSTDSLFIINIRDVKNPSLTWSGLQVSTVAFQPTNAVQGSYWYVVSPSENNLYVYDISTPSSPTLVNTISDTFGNTYLSGVIQGQYLYIYSFNGGILKIYSLATPSTPSLISTTTNLTGTQAGAVISSVAISGKVLFVTRDTSGTANDSVFAIDISDPSTPVVLGSVLTGFSPTVLVLTGKYLYVGGLLTTTTPGFKIYDVSVPASPSLVSTYNTSQTGVAGATGASNSVVVVGNRAYVGSTVTGNCYFESVNLQGVDAKSGNFASLTSGSLQVLQNLDSQNIKANDSLGVGIGGILSEGGIQSQSSIFGTSYLAGDGSASAPAFSFKSDTNTGIYRSAADTLNFTTAGASKWEIDSTGNFYPTTTTSYTIGTSTNKPSSIHVGTSGLILVPSNATVTASGTSLILTGAASSAVLTLASAGTFWNNTQPLGLSTDAAVGNNQFNSNIGLGGSTFYRPYGVYAYRRLNAGALTNTLNGGVVSVTGANAAPSASITITSDANASTTITLNNSTFTLRIFGVGDYIQLQGLSTIAKITAVSAGALTVDTALGDGTTRNVILIQALATFADSTGAIKTSIDYNGNIISQGYRISPSENNAGNSSTAQTIDWALASAQTSTLTGNVTYTFSNPVIGGAYVLKVLTGTGGFTATWPANVKWPGGVTPTVTTTASRMDLFNFYYDGTNFYGSYTQDYTP